MSQLEEIEKELREYIEKEPNMRRQDRVAYLIAIFNKHLEIRNLEHVVNYRDYFNILSRAKTLYTKISLPVRLSRKELEPNDSVHITTMESFVMYLNEKNLLKKLVKFDYTE